MAAYRAQRASRVRSWGISHRPVRVYEHVYVRGDLPPLIGGLEVATLSGC